MAIKGGSGYFKVQDQLDDKQAVVKIQYNQEERILLVWKQPHLQDISQ